MTKEETYNIIRTTVFSALPDSRILLFGSQAKGTADTQSDYDLLVITKKKMDREKRLNILAKLNRDLVRAIHAPVDVLMKSEGEAKIDQQLPGHIIQTAFREGVFL
ncbi:MAG: nucleotidyltransferase domain-containing protein [Sediminibacterium magnilacihabitans]|jgi:predicted nucleotidyltransferase|nr:nucleotidyltransferase domain-containing protein [Sediminibacterium magnilacihabitans]PQV60406.1 nucleotidyltransferase-like protein [Sediminibacterium magnilacihabitans]